MSVRNVYETYLRLFGRAGDRQFKDPKVAG